MRNYASTGRPDGGFSLIEALVTTIIIGIGVGALMTSVGSGTRNNAAGRDLTQASLLAQEMREWTVKLPFSDQDPGDVDNPPGPDGTDPQTFVDDLDDLLNVTYSPPRDGQGLSITDMAGWSQTIALTWRDPANLQTTVAAGSSDVIHVDLEIKQNGQSVLTTGWLVAKKD